MRIGSGFIGSASLETSVANKEIVPSSPQNLELYKFTLVNDQDCTVLINNKDRLFLRAKQGIASDGVDTTIHSFKIEQDGVTYNWAGAY